MSGIVLQKVIIIFLSCFIGVSGRLLSTVVCSFLIQKAPLASTSKLILLEVCGFFWYFSKVSAVSYIYIH